MKRGLVILLLGIAVAIGGFCAFYMSAVHRQKAALHGNAPELAWLKDEFELSDAEWQRVAQLHDGYLPKCAEMCERINKKNAELKQLLGSAEAMTPGIEAKLREANELRVECHRNMLAHFFEVSRAMPPAQGKRYLQWMHDRTILHPAGAMVEGHQTHD